jgi:hypothetical protein
MSAENQLAAVADLKRIADTARAAYERGVLAARASGESVAVIAEATGQSGQQIRHILRMNGGVGYTADRKSLRPRKTAAAAKTTTRKAARAKRSTAGKAKTASSKRATAKRSSK